MEADSTTYESNLYSSINEICLPFNCRPVNLNLYKEFHTVNGDRSLEIQLISKLQFYGLLPTNVSCLVNEPTCKVVGKVARVIDRVQWVCEGCGTRQPIRTGSFFYKLQCSILQVLQLILAWCEDVDLTSAAQYFDVKLRVANIIYDKLDQLVIKELYKSRLGGDNSLVLCEIYPDCLNRLSPDTTERPHMHRILMLTDNKRLPTQYRLHVLREDLKKSPGYINNEQRIKYEIEQVIFNITKPRSKVVSGLKVPLMRGVMPLQTMLRHCNLYIENFLCLGIWREAAALCEAGCGPRRARGGRAGLQRRLDAALYRRGHARGLYAHVLQLLAAHRARPGTRAR